MGCEEAYFLLPGTVVTDASGEEQCHRDLTPHGLRSHGVRTGQVREVTATSNSKECKSYVPRHGLMHLDIGFMVFLHIHSTFIYRIKTVDVMFPSLDPYSFEILFKHACFRICITRNGME